MRQLKISKSITNRETASLDKYLADIEKEEMVSADEEVQLAQRIKQGDQAALEKLCKANLRFVVSVAKQYQNQGLLLPDLINEGNFGLVKAARRFDETRGFKFISYAVWWIRQAILLALAEQSRMVRLPLNQIGSLSKISKAIVKLEQELERSPSDSEISLKLELPECKVVEIMQASKRIISMDAPIGRYDGEENNMYDVYPDGRETDERLIRESLEKEIERFVSTLTPREAEILRLHYGLDGRMPMTLEEIGEEFHLRRDQVYRIKRRAIGRLKTNPKTRPIRLTLLSYLG